jgi:pterin-4a-carbinolamine dehydratase
MFENWTVRERPARLEGRFEFGDYAGTRDFLERAAALSEKAGLYPDVSFGRTYVNLTLRPEDEAPLGTEHESLAQGIEALLTRVGT